MYLADARFGSRRFPELEHAVSGLAKVPDVGRAVQPSPAGSLHLLLRDDLKLRERPSSTDCLPLLLVPVPLLGLTCTSHTHTHTHSKFAIAPSSYKQQAIEEEERRETGSGSLLGSLRDTVNSPLSSSSAV